MRRILLTIAPLVVVAGCAATESASMMAPRGPLETAVWPLDKVELKKFDWGELRLCHFTAETHGTKDTLVGYVTLNPGMENHPPHQHAEEEFILITRGKGKLHVAGKDYPAAEGDMFYAAPWVFHGITNDSSEELSFFVIKWNGKNGPPPPKPEK